MKVIRTGLNFFLQRDIQEARVSPKASAEPFRQ
jgi:uncharacterized membrane protein